MPGRVYRVDEDGAHEVVDKKLIKLVKEKNMFQL